MPAPNINPSLLALTRRWAERMVTEVEGRMGQRIQRERLIQHIQAGIPEVAYHEAGHAVARYVFGFRVEAVELVHIGDDMERRGRTRVPLDPVGGLRLLPFSEPLDDSGFDTEACLLLYARSLASYLAGPIAQNRHLTLNAAGPAARWRTWEDWLSPEADDLDECLLVAFRLGRPDVAYESGPRDPRAAFLMLLQTDDGAAMREELSVAFEQASQLLEACWRAVEEVATRAMLADEGRLTEDEIDRICSGAIPSEFLDSIGERREQLARALEESRAAVVQRGPVGGDALGP